MSSSSSKMPEVLLNPFWIELDWYRLDDPDMFCAFFLTWTKCSCCPGLVSEWRLCRLNWLRIHLDHRQFEAELIMIMVDPISFPKTSPYWVHMFLHLSTSMMAEFGGISLFVRIERYSTCEHLRKIYQQLEETLSRLPARSFRKPHFFCYLRDASAKERPTVVDNQLLCSISLYILCHFTQLRQVLVPLPNDQLWQSDGKSKCHTY
jgi:hypothetical protein